VSQDVDDMRQIVGQLNGPPISEPATNTILRPFSAQIARYWWVELLLGVLWVVIAPVVLKFNDASVVTVACSRGSCSSCSRPRLFRLSWNFGDGGPSVIVTQ
jgi:hypothetical protein